MTWHIGLSKPKYKTGPRCGGCPFRNTSIGFVPPSFGYDDDGKSDLNTEFLFLFDTPRRDDIIEGRTAVGEPGKAFNNLLRANTQISRADQILSNTVCCRPIVFTADTDGNQIPLLQDNGDYTDVKPSSAQVRECANRYTNELVRRFVGNYIITLGKIPSEYMLGKSVSIQSQRGSVYSPGEFKKCECKDGFVIKEKIIKCKICKGVGQTFKGRGKSKIGMGCAVCLNTGTEIKISQKECPQCSGKGQVPLDPDDEFICDKLKQHQRLFLTFHPAALYHNPNYRPVVSRDFKMFEKLDEWMETEEKVEYEVYPKDNDVRISGMFARSERGLPISIDIETTGGLEPEDGDIYCVAGTSETGKGYCFDPGDPRIRQMLQQPCIVGQNFVLFDQWWFKQKGYEIPKTTKLYDTRYLGKYLNPDTPNDLVYMTGEFADPPIRGYWKTKENYRKDKEHISCIDVDATLRVLHGQLEKISDEGRMNRVEDYILPMSKVVFDMRYNGMKINKEVMDETRSQILDDLARKRLSLPWFRKNGTTGSEHQSGEVCKYLYEYRKLPVINNRKTGKPTGNSEALEELFSRLEINHRSVRHISDADSEGIIEVIKNIGECRDLSKLEGNFLRYKLSGSEFVHPALNMGGSSRGKHDAGRGTASWRFSCSNPNAQQVPKRARNIFIPDLPDWEIASIDLRQAEVIGFLWYAEEWSILNNILHHGMDAHQELANTIMQREATQEERDSFKTTTFALLFGESPRSTALRLHKPLPEIKAAREFYFKMLPGVTQYRADTIAEGRNHGYVESPFGFRRYVYIESEFGRAANQACNFKTQNFPPIVTGRAMIGMHNELPSPARLWMQSHDEVLLTYPKNMRKEVMDCAIAWFRKPITEFPAAPLKMAGGLVLNIDIEVGDNWRDLNKITKDFGL